MTATNIASSTFEDLWPADLGATDVVPPVVILRQQATMLGQRTQNILLGEVLSEPGEEDTIYHNFYIKAPALGNYRYKLFWISQKITSLYPIWISGSEQSLEDATMLRSALIAVFNSDNTKRVIQSLLAQSN